MTILRDPPAAPLDALAALAREGHRWITRESPLLGAGAAAAPAGEVDDELLDLAAAPAALVAVGRRTADEEQIGLYLTDGARVALFQPRRGKRIAMSHPVPLPVFLDGLVADVTTSDHADADPLQVSWLVVHLLRLLVEAGMTPHDGRLSHEAAVAVLRPFADSEERVEIMLDALEEDGLVAHDRARGTVTLDPGFVADRGWLVDRERLEVHVIDLDVPPPWEGGPVHRVMFIGPTGERRALLRSASQDEFHARRPTSAECRSLLAEALLTRPRLPTVPSRATADPVGGSEELTAGATWAGGEEELVEALRVRASGMPTAPILAAALHPERVVHAVGRRDDRRQEVAAFSGPLGSGIWRKLEGRIEVVAMAERELAEAFVRALGGSAEEGDEPSRAAPERHRLPASHTADLLARDWRAAPGEPNHVPAELADLLPPEALNLIATGCPRWVIADTRCRGTDLVADAYVLLVGADSHLLVEQDGDDVVAALLSSGELVARASSG
ncbi:MAG: hypothetical protein M3340_08615 [Actinomycetota bacterium]|nr:hypothetical protein [Actinomycetota bacterium]